MNSEAASLQVGFFREEEEHDRIIFQAKVSAKLAGALVLGEAAGDCV